jgi:hypothetical protein
MHVNLIYKRGIEKTKIKNMATMRNFDTLFKKISFS